MRSTSSSMAGLSRRERQIVEIVHRIGESSAAAIRAEMPDAPSDSALRTLLTILERKGRLAHRQDGRRYLYRAVESHAAAARGAVRQVMHTFFGDSVEQAVAALLADARGGITAEEAARLERLIADLKDGLR